MQYFHHYSLWEDFKHGFYDSVNGNEYQDKINKVVEMFNCENTTKEMMFKIVDEWVYSCQHNLTNNSINKIAYIGQCACCLFGGVPSTVTMKAWSLLTNDVKERSNKLAKQAIRRWETKNKSYQLCLKLD